MRHLIYITLAIIINCNYCYAVDPLLYNNNLVYQGAFQLPGGTIGSSSFDYGGYALAFNPANNSLFITGHTYSQQVAEISIPTPMISSNPGNLKTASVLQTFADITEGHRRQIGPGGTDVFGANDVNIGGLLVYNGKLIGTSYAYYDTRAVSSHFTSSLTLSNTGDFAGMYAVGSTATGTPSASFVDGFMTYVPSLLQSSLGGSVLTGNGCLSVINRTSYGPAAFAFDPGRLGIDNPVAATPLLYYTADHSTLNPVTGSGGEIAKSQSHLFNWTTKIAGMVLIPGTRTLLYIGYHGVGPFSYGNSTTDPTQIGTNCLGDGETCYYDPAQMGAKGPHAFPYFYQIWAYNIDDLAAVKAGTKKPWEVVPYAVWQPPIPFRSTDLFGGAAAIDPNTMTLYVAQPRGADYGMPLIHVFHIDTSSVAASTYSIKPTVMLLNGTLKLKNNGGDELTVSASNRATVQQVSFATGITPGGSYNVSISSQPSGQTCALYNASGTVNANDDVTNVVISCDGSGGSYDVPGSCGPSNGIALSSAPTVGLCSAGTASAVSGTGPWSWTCAGSGGGSTASCSATLLDIPSGDTSAAVACSAIAGFR